MAHSLVMPLLVVPTSGFSESCIGCVGLSQLAGVEFVVILLSTLGSGELTVALIGEMKVTPGLCLRLALLDVGLNRSDVVVAILSLELGLVLGTALGIPLLTALPSALTHPLDPVVHELVPHGVSFCRLIRQAYS